jgi:hypothetical protein
VSIAAGLPLPVLPEPRQPLDPVWTAWIESFFPSQIKL